MTRICDWEKEALEYEEPGMPYKVIVKDDDGELNETYRALDYVTRIMKIKLHDDVAIHMHGGRVGFSTLSFRDKQHAMIFKLGWVSQCT